MNSEQVENSHQGSQVHPEQSHTNYKKTFHPLLFWLFLLSSTFLTIQQYLSFFNISLMWISFGISLGATIPIFILVFRTYAQSKCELLKLLILIDNFFVCWLTSVFGLIGAMRVFNLISVDLTETMVVSFIILVDIFTLTGVYRVLFKYARWRNWQIVCCKISLGAVMILHIDLASNVILSESTPETLKEFAFIYVFGYFSLYYELFAKFTDIDGTASLKTNYEPVERQEEKEEPLNKREPINL